MISRAASLPGRDEEQEAAILLLNRRINNGKPEYYRS